MNPLMAAQILTAAKRLAAVSAGERALSRRRLAVRLLMGLQMGLSYEALATLIARERLLFVHGDILVNSLMSEEVRLADEAFAAFGTVVGSLRSVNGFLVPH